MNKPGYTVTLSSVGSALVSAIAPLSVAPLAILSLLPPPANAQVPSPLEALEEFEYWNDLCELHIGAEEYALALKACEKAIALEPKNADVWVLHSGISLQLQNYPGAIASANHALSLNAESSLAIAYQCVAYTELGQNETALDHCNDALRVNGNWGHENPALAWFYRGEILAQAQQYELALVAYERTLLLEPDDSLTLTRECEAYVALNDATAALQSCTAALAGNGRWGMISPALAWTYQGQAHTQLNQYDAAIAAYDQSIRIDPHNALTWAAQGQVLEVVNRNEEALVSYKQAVALKADYAWALLGECTVLNRLSSYQEALAACESGIKEGDSDWGDKSLADAWNERSIALVGMGQYEDALASINRAVGIEPDYVAAHNHRSIVLWYLGQYTTALTANQQGLDLDETYAPGWLTRGLLFRATGQYAESLEAYNKGLTLDDSQDWAWSNRSVVLWELGDYEEAIASAEQAIARNSSSVQAWYNRGAAQSALGDYIGAIDSYDQVLVLDEQYADALTGRGVAWFHLNNDEAATTDLQAALALNPDDDLAKDTLTALTPPTDE